MSPATIDIDVMRGCDGADLLTALEAEGFEGTLIEADDCLHVRVGAPGVDTEEMRSHLESLIDTWIVERDLPLIPTPVGEDSYVLHLPGD